MKKIGKKGQGSKWIEETGMTMWVVAVMLMIIAFVVFIMARYNSRGLTP